MRLLLILILVPVIFLTQKFLVHPAAVKNASIHVKEAPLSPEPTQNPSSSISATEFPATNTVTPSPTNRVNTPTSPPTSQPQTTQNSQGDFVYPGATKTGTSGSSTFLQTNDNVQTVTNWYKDKIKNLGWNTTSIIENNTNDDVSNQLVASNGTSEVRIQIAKSSNSSTVNITVAL